ncbi:cytochrome-b5 reductase [Malassezia cuniculi]|uniref:Cytochrome-b5 reductase n=1 Tax=Malassezia cuniculi TaxID=948313 RepID=A0AAF0ERQ0_9BASI|nr:cytochrome-b5 reductase [Malassezia cuniculi]
MRMYSTRPAPPSKKRFIAAALGSIAGAAAAAVAVSRFSGGDVNEILPNKYGTLDLVETQLRPPTPSTEHEAPLHRIMAVQGSAPLVPADVSSCLSIYSFYVKEPTLQVERAYTPIAMLARQDASKLTFLIKRYADGEVSRYLHRLRPGAQVSLRGPEVTWQLPAGAPVPRHIYMIVAGTGIATAAQLVSNVFESDLPTLPHISIMYAAQSLDSVQLVPELVSVAQKTGKVDVSVWCERINPAQRRLPSLEGTVDADVKTLSTWRSTRQVLQVGGYDVPLYTGRIGVRDLGAVENSPDSLSPVLVAAT